MKITRVSPPLATESEAWFRLAEDFATKQGSKFLCLRLSYMAQRGEIGWVMRTQMRARIQDDLSPEDEGVAYFALQVQGTIPDAIYMVEPRWMAALMFGYEAESEGR